MNDDYRANPLDTAGNAKQLMAAALQHHRAGRLPEAERIYRQILLADRDNAAALRAMGLIAQQSARPTAAVTLLRRAIELQPHNANAHNTLGVALLALGRDDHAEQSYREAIRRDPKYPEAYNNLGLVLAKTNRVSEAIESFRRAVTLRPDYASAHLNLSSTLGEALRDTGRYAAAATEYRRAIQIDPQLAGPYTNLGVILGHMRDHAGAAEALRKAVCIDPSNHEARSNLLMELNYLTIEPQSVFQQHVEWDKVHGIPLRNQQPPIPKRPPNRPLRIGYVSPDLRHHPVAYFLEPVLRNHDHVNFRIFCYSDVAVPDETSERLRGFADDWRDISRANTDEFLRIIRGDEIDVLVDLAGHTAHNRLLVFAQRAAPVQISYIGYPNTSGLETMDFRFTDDQADPPGMTDRFFTEELIRLPHGFLCYAAPDDAPPVSPPPAQARGYVTFGSFNKLAKISDELIAAWAGILLRVANSRLMIKALALGESEVQDALRRALASCGVTLDRVIVAGPDPSFKDHLAHYSDIDIALDTFPYNGTTTTCEAMWMGVPVVTLAGATHVSRVGASLLTHRGLSEYIASDFEQYARTAADLAGDVSALAAARAVVREQMKASPLLDGVKITRSIENAFRAAVAERCEASRPT